MTFVAGPQTVTYTPSTLQGGGSALSLGIVEDGYEIEHVSFADPIRGDNLGESIQDGVYRGRDCFVNAVLEEFDLEGVRRAILQPWVDADAVTDIGEIGQVGRLLSNIAGILTITPVAGTTAATSATPGVLTANKAILAPGFPVRFLLATRLRKIPIRFQLLPYTDSGDTVHFRWAANV